MVLMIRQGLRVWNLRALFACRLFARRCRQTPAIRRIHNRGDAFAILMPILEQFRALGYKSLQSRVNQPAECEWRQHNHETIQIDIKVLWNDRKQRDVCIIATVHGPSTFRMECFEERLVVSPP